MLITQEEGMEPMNMSFGNYFLIWSESVWDCQEWVLEGFLCRHYRGYKFLKIFLKDHLSANFQGSSQEASTYFFKLFLKKNFKPEFLRIYFPGPFFQDQNVFF